MRISYEKEKEGKEENGKWVVLRKSPYIGNIMSFTLHARGLTEIEADEIIKDLESKLNYKKR